MPDRNFDPHDRFDRDPDFDSTGRRANRGYGDYRVFRDGQSNRRYDEYGDYGSDDVRSFGDPRNYPPAQPPRSFRQLEGEQWRGRFFGRGPKGYRRSDERIHEEVSDRLTTHPDVDASDIEVRVDQGIVTLSGTVDTRHEKRIAEYIAEDALGVDDVHNQLKVHHGFWSTLSGERATERQMHREPERDR